jgi:HK97 family phage major capsid protein
MSVDVNNVSKPITIEDIYKQFEIVKPLLAKQSTNEVIIKELESKMKTLETMFSQMTFEQKRNLKGFDNIEDAQGFCNALLLMKDRNTNPNDLVKAGFLVKKSEGYKIRKERGIEIKGVAFDSKASEAFINTTRDTDTPIVNPVYSDVILRIPTVNNFFRTHCTVIRIAGYIQSYLRETVGVSAAWKKEGAAYAPTKPVLNRFEVYPGILGALVSATVEILRRTNIDIANYLLTLVREAMSYQEEYSIINAVLNVNDAPFNGLLANTDIPLCYLPAGNVNFGNMALADFNRAKNYLQLQLSKLMAPNIDITFIANADVLEAFGERTDGNGRSLLNTEIAGMPATIKGYKVFPHYMYPSIFTSAPSTIFMTGGDWTGLSILMEEDLQVSFSDQYGFNTGMLYWRFDQCETIMLPFPTKLVHIKTPYILIN